MLSSFVCPETKNALKVQKDHLINPVSKHKYPFLQYIEEIKVPVFVNSFERTQHHETNKVMYDSEGAATIYRNFLDWLFATFNEKEEDFRNYLIDKCGLTPGDKLLITGCGLGDDIFPALKKIGKAGEIHANDLSREMIEATFNQLKYRNIDLNQIVLSVCDATKLPYPENYFDAALHFGGINLFSDIKSAITEMSRVVKPGGKVVFGDEGIAPWLKNTEYWKIAVTNNKLWSAEAPIDKLPSNALDVNLSWVLGNCFYLINFTKSETGPDMNIDIPHKGRRGGTMRTRYFGQLEGVTEETKRYVISEAERVGLSIHEWLEKLIGERKNSNQ